METEFLIVKKVPSIIKESYLKIALKSVVGQFMDGKFKIFGR